MAAKLNLVIVIGILFVSLYSCKCSNFDRCARVTDEETLYNTTSRTLKFTLVNKCSEQVRSLEVDVQKEDKATPICKFGYNVNSDRCGCDDHNRCSVTKYPDNPEKSETWTITLRYDGKKRVFNMDVPGNAVERSTANYIDDKVPPENTPNTEVSDSILDFIQTREFGMIALGSILGLLILILVIVLVVRKLKGQRAVPAVRTNRTSQDYDVAYEMRRPVVPTQAVYIQTNRDSMPGLEPHYIDIDSVNETPRPRFATPGSYMPMDCLGRAVSSPRKASPAAPRLPPLTDTMGEPSHPYYNVNPPSHPYVNTPSHPYCNE